MSGLLISTVLFFIVMPVIAAVTCCYLYNKDDDMSQFGVKTPRNPLV